MTHDEYADIMEEAPGGANYGRERVAMDPNWERGTGSGWRSLERHAGSLAGFQYLRADAHHGGIKSHRGAVHPNEYVDDETLKEAIEQALGTSVDELTSIYRRGPLSDAQARRKSELDRVIARIADAGGNMALFARLTGLDRRTMQRAIARGREAA